MPLPLLCVKVMMVVQYGWRWFTVYALTCDHYIGAVTVTLYTILYQPHLYPGYLAYKIWYAIPWHVATIKNFLKYNEVSWNWNMYAVFEMTGNRVVQDDNKCCWTTRKFVVDNSVKCLIKITILVIQEESVCCSHSFYTVYVTVNIECVFTVFTLCTLCLSWNRLPVLIEELTVLSGLMKSVIINIY